MGTMHKRILSKTILFSLALLCLCPKAIFAFGEPPDFSKKDTSVFKAAPKPAPVEPVKAAPVAMPEVNTKNAFVALVGTANADQATIDEAIKDQRKKAMQFVQLKQFEKAKTTIESIPTTSRNTADEKLRTRLMFFDKIDSEAKENSQIFKKDQTDPEVERVTKRLYSGAQAAYLTEDNDLAKDLLIQTIYEDRSHFKAKKMLEYAYGMAPGNYQIENIEAKYWKLSLVNLYSGYPEKAVKNLQALEMFDPENPTVFERMGSAYYSMGEMQKAVQAWKRAAFLNPSNKDLEKFIQNAEEEIKKQNAMALEDSRARTKKTQSSSGVEEMQLLRIVNDANTAYSYAQEVRKQMPGVNVVVEEADNGKWAVKIPAKKSGTEKSETQQAPAEPQKNTVNPQKRGF